jgi:hypothetical protein
VAAGDRPAASGHAYEMVDDGCENSPRDQPPAGLVICPGAVCLA